MTSPSQFPPDSAPTRNSEPGTPARPAEVVALLDTAVAELAPRNARRRLAALTTGAPAATDNEGTV